jgi:hypothetical protein
MTDDLQAENDRLRDYLQSTGERLQYVLVLTKQYRLVRNEAQAENARLRTALEHVQRLLEQSSQYHVYLPVNVMQARDVIRTALAPNAAENAAREDA